MRASELVGRADIDQRGAGLQQGPGMLGGNGDRIGQASSAQ
jgi:hypothetical protein